MARRTGIGRWSMASLGREGWVAAIAAALLLLAGRILGVFELVVFGAALAALVAAALTRLALMRLQLGVRRTLTPPRVNAGQPARVELILSNSALRRTPVLQLRDAVTGTRGANLLVSPLPAGATARAAYLLPTAKRGKLSVGPLTIELTDPFGLTRSRIDAVGRSELIVFPKIDRIKPIPTAASHDPQATARQPNALGRAGDDFYALRPYQVGDDLRRVHWPATAHADELMIRQHEMPWQERTTVVLDVRTYSQTPESFELCVSAAASVLHAAFRGGDQIRLITTAGADSGFGLARAHLDACLERLALVSLDQDASLQRSVDVLRRTGGGGSLVLVIAAAAAGDLGRLGPLRQHYGKFITVLFEPSSWDGPVTEGTALPMAGTMVRVTDDNPFARTWDRAMQTSDTSPLVAGGAR